MAIYMYDPTSAEGKFGQIVGAIQTKFKPANLPLAIRLLFCTFI